MNDFLTPELRTAHEISANVKMLKEISLDSTEVLAGLLVVSRGVNISGEVEHIKTGEDLRGTPLQLLKVTNVHATIAERALAAGQSTDEWKINVVLLEDNKSELLYSYEHQAQA